MDVSALKNELHQLIESTKEEKLLAELYKKINTGGHKKNGLVVGHERCAKRAYTGI